MFNYQDFGLKKEILYEIIATTYSIEEKTGKIGPNAACMGIRVLDNCEIAINPFPNTSTYKNLKENSLLVINFVDNVYLYALAALKESDSHIGIKKFPSKYFGFRDMKLMNTSLPYVNKSWGFLICEVVEQLQKRKEGSMGEYVLTEFRLNVLLSEKLKESFNLFNRAENLVIESIILATRIKIAKIANNPKLYNDFLNQLAINIENIERFGRNKQALKAVSLIKKYVDNL